MPHVSRHIALNPAEAETLRALADQSMTNPQLAGHFGVTEAAIASRLHRLYERTDFHGRTAVVLFAVEHKDCCLARVSS